MNQEVDQIRKSEWKIKKAVVDQIIACGGSIFGGAVRDMYRHDIYADMYYDAHTTGEDHSEEYIKYNDSSYLPHTIGRMDIPCDIDACIPASKEKALLEAFGKMNLDLKKDWERDPSGYFRSSTIVNGQVTHYRYIISTFNSKSIIRSMNENLFPTCLKNMPGFIDLICNFHEQLESIPYKSFTLDLMVINDDAVVNFKVDAPFGNLDFECNGLIMDKHGIRLSEHVKPDITNPIQRQGQLMRVLDDVLYKRAIMCERVTVIRCNKMLAKGWLVQSTHICLVTNSYLAEQSESSCDDGSSSTGGYCIICHEECENPHYKLTCCDARYHGKCLVDCWNSSSISSIRRTKKCPMCRYSMDGPTVDNVYIDTLVHVLEETPSQLGNPTDFSVDVD